MGKWLRSGLRRDVCILLAALGEPTGQECKAELESRYDEHVEPRTFYGALEALVEGGHVRTRSDGIHDRYALTEPGQRMLESHHAWTTACLEGREPSGDEPGRSGTDG